MTKCSRTTFVTTAVVVLVAAPGCKFPKELHGSWNFTYLHARSLDISLRKMELVLLDGRRLLFSCEARDSKRYVIR